MTPPVTRHRAGLSVILALAAAPYFIGLGSSSLWDSNEAFYAETPRVMIQSGDYVNPVFNGQPRFNKPPLSYWVVAAFYKVFGVSEAVERLPIALGAMVLVATAYALGRTAFSANAGLLAAIALAATPRFLMFSRRIIIDVYIAMFMGLALLFFMLAERQAGRRRLYLMLMYASVGLGVMTKGPIAAVLPAAAFLIHLAIHRELSRLGRMMLPTGLVIVLAIVVPWYAAIYAEHGWQHIEAFFLGENLLRYTQPVGAPRRDILFYVPVILGDLFPWSVFLLPAMVLAAIERRRVSAGSGGSTDDLGARHRRLLLIWIVAIVVFFSLSRTKQDLYVLPIVPAAAALVGGLLARITTGHPTSEASRRLWRWTTALAAALIAGAGGGILYMFGAVADRYVLDGAIGIGVTAAGGGLVGLGLAIRQKPLAAVISATLSIVAVHWCFVLRTLPDFERYKPVRPFSQIIQASRTPDALVGYYRFAAPSLVFYLRRPVFEYFDVRELQAAWSSGKAVYCLLTVEDYDAVKATLPGPTYVLASRPTFDVRFKHFMERAPLPQLVLVSNTPRAISGP